MSNISLEFHEFARFLADEAASISRKYFRQNLSIQNKSNDTPVTIADKEIESHLRELIRQRYPEHSIIGEEFSNHRGDSPYAWVIDPIDGTVAFSCGKPTFCTLVALLENNHPVLGVIDQPISQERFWGVINHDSYCNQQKIQASKIVQLKNARMNATTPYMFKTDAEQMKFAKLKELVKLTSFGGDAYAFALLAAGHIDIILEADLQYYDIAALIPVVEGAGGVISDWQGSPLSQNFNGQCLASANSQLHSEALRILNP